MRQNTSHILALLLVMLLAPAAPACAQAEWEANAGNGETDAQLSYSGNVEEMAPEGTYGDVGAGSIELTVPAPGAEHMDLADDERYQLNKFLSDFAVGHFCVARAWDDESQREVRKLSNFSGEDYDVRALVSFAWTLVRINQPQKLVSKEINGIYYGGYPLELINEILDLYLGLRLEEAEIPSGEYEDYGYYCSVQDGCVYMPNGDGNSYWELTIARDVSLIGDAQLQLSFDVYEVYDQDIAPVGETIQDDSVYYTAAEDAANRDTFVYDYSGSAVISFDGSLNDRDNFTLIKYTLDETADSAESEVAPSAETFDSAESEVVPFDGATDSDESVVVPPAEAYGSDGVTAPYAEAGLEAAGNLFSMIPSQFYFSSGVGAWGTEITINPDGSFSGEHSDTNAGDSGPGYDYTQYLSEFSGQFVNPRQIDEYTWRFELGSLTYDTPVGETEIVPDSYDPDIKVRMLYTDAYGIEGGKTFYLYMPGTPTALLPVGFIDWANAYSAAEGPELTRCGIYNLEGQYGFIAAE